MEADFRRLAFLLSYVDMIIAWDSSLRGDGVQNSLVEGCNKETGESSISTVTDGAQTAEGSEVDQRKRHGPSFCGQA